MKAKPRSAAKFSYKNRLKESGEFKGLAPDTVLLFGEERLRALHALLNDAEFIELDTMANECGISTEDLVAYIVGDDAILEKTRQLKDIATDMVEHIDIDSMINNSRGNKMYGIKKDNRFLPFLNKVEELSKHTIRTFKGRPLPEVFARYLRALLLRAFTEKINRCINKRSNWDKVGLSVSLTSYFSGITLKSPTPGNQPEPHPIAYHWTYVAETIGQAEVHKDEISHIGEHKNGDGILCNMDEAAIVRELDIEMGTKIRMPDTSKNVGNSIVHFTSASLGRTGLTAAYICVYLKINFPDTKTGVAKSFFSPTMGCFSNFADGLNLQITRGTYDIEIYRAGTSLKRILGPAEYAKFRLAILRTLWGVVHDLPFDSLDDLVGKTPESILTQTNLAASDTVSDTISEELTSIDIEAPEDGEAPLLPRPRKKKNEINMGNLRVVDCGDLHTAMTRLFGTPRGNGKHAVYKDSLTGKSFFVPRHDGFDLTASFIKKLLRQTGLTPTQLYSALYD